MIGTENNERVVQAQAQELTHLARNVSPLRGWFSHHVERYFHAIALSDFKNAQLRNLRIGLAPKIRSLELSHNLCVLVSRTLAQFQKVMCRVWPRSFEVFWNNVVWIRTITLFSVWRQHGLIDPIVHGAGNQAR